MFCNIWCKSCQENKTSWNNTKQYEPVSLLSLSIYKWWYIYIFIISTISQTSLAPSCLSFFFASLQSLAAFTVARERHGSLKLPEPWPQGSCDLLHRWWFRSGFRHVTDIAHLSCLIHLKTGKTLAKLNNFQNCSNLMYMVAAASISTPKILDLTKLSNSKQSSSNRSNLKHRQIIKSNSSCAFIVASPLCLSPGSR